MPVVGPTPPSSGMFPSSKTPSGNLPPRRVPGSGLPPARRDKRLRTSLVIGGLLFVLLFVVVVIIAASSSGDNQLLQTLGFTGDSKAILGNIVNVIFGIGSTIALIALVVGGFMRMASLGDPEQLHRSRRLLIISSISLLFVLFAWGALILMLNQRPADAPIEIPLESQQRIITQPDPAEGSAPFNVTFDVTGLPEAGYFFGWDFGDGGLGTGKVIQHVYQREGLYEPSVTITDSNARTTLLKARVFIRNTKPLAKFFADPIKGRAPLDVKFDAIESKDPNGSITKYEWDFGDSFVATGDKNLAVGQKAVHTFTRDGSYTVTLTVTDNSFDTSTMTQTIDVGPQIDAPISIISTTPPMQDGTPPTLTGTTPFKVSFSGAKSRIADGQITGYKWDFGDGTPSENSQTATHTYPISGTYTATLSVTSSEGKTDSTTVQITSKDPSKAPVAKFLSTPPANAQGEIKKEVPLIVKLDGGGSMAFDGALALYSWNFGDNAPIKNGQTTEYTYTTPGTYTLQLVVKDVNGVESPPATITVKALSATKAPPVAVISTTPTPASGNVPFSVQFDGSGSSDPDGNIISYEWNFGDGMSILSSAEVSHIYNSPGIYKVKLTVHDNDGLTGTIEIPVAAQLAAPIAKIRADRTSGTPPLSVRLDASDSSGSITRYDWDFNDGSQGTGRVVTHNFTGSGDYTVKLTISDASNQVDTETLTISVQ